MSTNCNQISTVSLTINSRGAPAKFPENQFLDGKIKHGWLGNPLLVEMEVQVTKTWHKYLGFPIAIFDSQEVGID